MTFLNSLVGRFLTLSLALSVAVPTTLFLLSIGKFEREFLESLFDRARALSSESGYGLVVEAVADDGGNRSDRILESVNSFATMVAEDVGINHFAIRYKQPSEGGQSVSRLHLLNSALVPAVGTPPPPEQIIQRYDFAQTSHFEFVRRGPDADI